MRTARPATGIDLYIRQRRYGDRRLERLSRELPLPFASVLLKKEQDFSALAEHRSGGVRRRLGEAPREGEPSSGPPVPPLRGKGGCISGLALA